MLSSNSENPKKGKDFESQAGISLKNKYGQFFDKKSINIGNPPKAHIFDLVSEDGIIIAECKNYSWTNTGNIPAAKNAVLNEAVLFLLHTPVNSKKIIILRKDRHPKRRETYAEYYVRTYFHLLNDITVMELDVDSMKLKEIIRA